MINSLSHLHIQPKTKKVLAEQEEFEPMAAFARIDQLRKGRIDVDDIEEFLLSNQLEYA